ncbi:putative DNA (cytosine-5)-methyltransferase CMT1 [Macadamia integrifolia]|uniref:putative DNA (cytosine-5)-methyltransferase CMT1 n=1 Tax=Macadamia integrifolia TaxID=60698 RepID=UPI001C4E4E72|nr:putative DNA (cytosine-5)-methyltransferase CMT1 [Macadamia integrifolia]
MEFSEADRKINGEKEGSKGIYCWDSRPQSPVTGMEKEKKGQEVRWKGHGPTEDTREGIEGHRNKDAPLEDKKNHQLAVFMDIVNFLKPKFVLMENVVDILKKFVGGFLKKYAVGRLVSMNYQARLGMMKLPQYPLPTHEAVVRGNVFVNFKVRRKVWLHMMENALLLEDAISNLPPVTNDESRDEMPYGKTPKIDFSTI